LCLFIEPLPPLLLAGIDFGDDASLPERKWSYWERATESERGPFKWTRRHGKFPRKSHPLEPHQRENCVSWLTDRHKQDNNQLSGFREILGSHIMPLGFIQS
jgi:hypothetical protein